jgi:CheY-like chemotaxis protein
MMKVPKRFILIDDDAIGNMLGQELIRRVCGEVEVQLFMDPAKALHYIEQTYNQENEVPTMLFLDIHTPSMTGWEFLDKYKQYHTIHDQFTVFMLSASDDQRDLKNAMSDNLVSGLIIKPLSKKIVQELISGTPNV